MRLKLLAATAALCIAMPLHVAAQEASQDGAVLTYAPAYFDAYSPVTALDMVAQVPGFSINNGAEVRGLADTFANVLIDGERQSTKSESIQQILQRIPVASVERVELIRQVVAGVDMRGQTRVINVVLAEDAGASSTLEISADYWVGSGRITPEVIASTSWDMGNTRLTVGGEFTQNGAPLLRDEYQEGGAGALIETRSERTSRMRTSPRLNASLTTRFDDDSRLSLSLNGGITDGIVRDRSLATLPGGPLDRIELYTSDSHGTSLEGTATYERPITESLSGQLVFLNRDDTYSSDDVFTFTPAAGSGSTNYYAVSVDDGERALRGTLTWEVNDHHSIEIGAETALNYLESGLEIMKDTGAGPVAVPLPVANTRVEEQRSELFVSHVWHASEAVTVESGFRLEHSTIEQTGDAQRSRSFDYPKPSITLTWDQTAETQWTVSLEREISQLSFGQFASEVSPTESQVVIGNPELVPSKVWRGSVAWERRWGPEASLTVSLTHERTEDVNDLRPVTVVVDSTTAPVTTATFDAPGNIGDGQRTYLLVEAAIPLDRLGLSGARLDVSGMLRDSQVTDPTTGETRRYMGNEDWRLSMDFRQNFTEQKLAWGWGYYNQGNEDAFRYDQSMVWTYASPRVNAWIETTAIDGMTLRLTWGDFLPSVRERERTFYTGSRADNIVRGREFQQQDLGGYLIATARRTF